ncbi:AI-2E family transporter [Peribacillus saganii]|uniref:AI-2E family transporter n=1 Tax=Peribacillus saganii TaxID=2303992 RepID=A0A372LU83_9BACI|nr:AI-2E family transporter [Peribacillus saganii]RFU71626.1 AI-2E family transporter [Peribacillus saganii]
MDVRLKWYYRLGFLLLLFIVAYIFIKLKPLWLPVLDTLVSVLIPFLAAAFISYLLHPVVEVLHDKGVKRWLAITIIYILFFGGLGLAIYKGIPAIVEQIRELSDSAPRVAEQYRGWLKKLDHKTSHWPFGLHERLEEGIEMIETSLNGLLSNAVMYAMQLFNFIVYFALIPLIAFYILKDIEAIKKMFWYLTPRTWRSQSKAFIRDVDASLGGYIRGQLTVCVIIGGLSSLLFWIFDMKYPLLLGIIIGITNVIPYFGPFFGAIPAVAIGATYSPKMVLIVIVIIFVLQFLEGNILSPLIVGKSLHMHPLFIMFALLTGGKVGGVIGMITAVPMLAIVKVALLHSRIHFLKLKSPKDLVRE